MNKKLVVHDQPVVGVSPWRQIHAHSTGNNAPAKNEIAYLDDKTQTEEGLEKGFFTDVIDGQTGEWTQVGKRGQGAWDIGGDWNFETYAAIELTETATNAAEFKKGYQAYLKALVSLAKEADIAITVDTNDTAGIKTHRFANETGHGSSHVDPFNYLAKWGVSRAQFAKDIASTAKGVSVSTPAKASTTKATAKSDVDKFRASGIVKWNHKNFKANLVEKHNGIWQAVSYELAANGKKSYTWTNNGVPLSVVTRTNNKDQSHFNAGDTFRFDNDQMKIVAYDKASNGIKVRPSGNGSLDFWVDATVALKA